MAQRIEAAIEWRKIQGGKETCSIAIDATKVAQFLEVSHAHGDIIGGEYPHHLVPFDGMDKIKVQELLDGKLEEYRKVSIVSEVKVTVISFQDTPSGVLTVEFFQDDHNQTMNQTISLRTWNPQPVLRLSRLEVYFPISLLVEYLVNQLTYGSQSTNYFPQIATIWGLPTQTTMESPGAIKLLHQAETRAYNLAAICLTHISFA